MKNEAIRMTYSCRHGECADCSGGVYEGRKIAGVCGCGCHVDAGACAHESVMTPDGNGSFCLFCGETLA